MCRVFLVPEVENLDGRVLFWCLTRNHWRDSWWTACARQLRDDGCKESGGTGWKVALPHQQRGCGGITGFARSGRVSGRCWLRWSHSSSFSGEWRSCSCCEAAVEIQTRCESNGPKGWHSRFAIFVLPSSVALLWSCHSWGATLFESLLTETYSTSVNLVTWSLTF